MMHARALLEKIQRSSHFSGEPMLAELLEYLCVRSQDGIGPNEEEIRAEILASSPLTLEQALDEVRARIRAYFAGEGRRDPLRVTIPAGQLGAYFFEAGQAQTPSTLDRFWAVHGPDTVLVHGSHSGGMITLDEAYALMRLAAFFQDRRIPLEIRVTDELPEAGTLILIGHPESHPLLARLHRRADRPIVRRIGGRITLVTAPKFDQVRQAITILTSEDLLEETLGRVFAEEFPPDFDFSLGKP